MNGDGEWWFPTAGLDSRLDVYGLRYELLENEDSSRSDSECSDSFTIIQHIFRWFRRYVY
ncbi:hypothetical protein NQ318_005981 [Aromia moschata]|uniref:Uncharacterized protein n=1 Tax=Aromia moschata TaxID=1265417 RepID=A0AAV8XY16_9CUCU|nr:hypothetical protein NQ318_005981 [Aromia moschata]